jgi:glycosyltransferase involved in cell wall biosynthesis
MKKISVVIPCFNSENTLPHVFEELSAILINNQYNYEIVLVNDCSSDNTWQEIIRLHSLHPNIIGINLSKNFGQASAMLAGYSFVSGDVVVHCDDDGQTPLNVLVNLLKKLDEGFDIVFAEYDKSSRNLFQSFASSVNNIMASVLLGKPKGITLDSFWVCRRSIANVMSNSENPTPYLAGYMLSATSKIGTVPAIHRSRLVGKSNYNLPKLINLWLSGFTGFSVLPLRLAALWGLLVSFMAFVFMLAMIYKKLANPSMPVGYVSILAVIIFMTGNILLAIGLVGEYVGRCFLILNKKPQYVIKDII